MKTEAVNIDNYIGVEPDEQFEFLYNNFFVMESLIKEYREDLIKEVIEQKAFNRRSNSGDLGVRIQVSLGISNPTQNMAIDRILVSQAIDEGYLTEEFFKDTDDRENLIHKVTCYHYVNNDYLQFNRKLHQMEPIEQKLICPYLMKEKTINDLVEDMGIDYRSAITRVSRIKKKLVEQVTPKLAINNRIGE